MKTAEHNLSPMATLAGNASGQATATPPTAQAGSGAGELAELFRAFNDVTARLQSTHEELRGQVASLTRDLGEANAQLQRAQRLAALGEMAAGIAHEVRNPLGGIRLYARMLEQDLSDRPREQTAARKIADAARTLEAVVGDVLSFSREFKLRAEPIDVSELFDATLEACCHDGVPGWRSVRIVRKDRESSIREIEADRAVLQQALVNIVCNALQAMTESATHAGSHTLTLDVAPRVEIDSKGRRFQGVALIVEDTGPGISPEIVARMFNPFFTTRNTGTGLGLAIVHRIMDAHAGRVVVRNNADSITPRNGQLARGDVVRGATFELILPQGTRGISQERPVNEPMSDVVVRTPARAIPVETLS